MITYLDVLSENQTLQLKTLCVVDFFQPEPPFLEIFRCGVGYRRISV